MVTRCAVLLLGILTAASACDKPKLRPYGFIKGDMYFATDGVHSWGQPQPTAASSATGVDSQSTAFSAAHSRFGLKGKTDVDDIEIGGRLELDFFSTQSNTNANANPRMRLAYAWCEPVPELEIRVGQQWDLFSPLNPTTNNTNANLWYNGNYGFRRPQFQVRYWMDFGKVTQDIQASIGEGAKESVGIGADNRALVPMIQGRVGAEFVKTVDLGVSGLYTAFGAKRDHTAKGVSVDLAVTPHKLLSIKGEFGYGVNLNDANVFTIAGEQTRAGNEETVGFWVNAIGKPAEYLHLVAGFADEMVISTVEDAEKESNLTAYGDIIFPIGKVFSLALEYQYLLTSVKGEDDPRSANVLDLAGKVVF